MQKIRITFSKVGLLAYISHLDMLRLFERACRRARLPLKLTEGFNPHPKISIIPAVAVGVIHDNLTADVVLTRRMEPAEILKRLTAVLPDMIVLKEAQELDR
jgi:radical SAM-linked protein